MASIFYLFKWVDGGSRFGFLDFRFHSSSIVTCFLLSLLCFTSGGLSIYHGFLSNPAMMNQRHEIFKVLRTVSRMMMHTLF